MGCTRHIRVRFECAAAFANAAFSPPAENASIASFSIQQYQPAKECIRAFRHHGRQRSCLCIGLCHVDAADHWPGFIAQLPSTSIITFRPTKWKKIIIMIIVMHRLARRRRRTKRWHLNVSINFLGKAQYFCESHTHTHTHGRLRRHNIIGNQCPNAADCVRMYIQSSAAANRTTI